MEGGRNNGRKREGRMHGSRTMVERGKDGGR